VARWRMCGPQRINAYIVSSLEARGYRILLEDADFAMDYAVADMEQRKRR